jgi:hypothetical protein
MLAALSIRASNSPPKRLFKGFVSPGKTKSVKTAIDSEGVFACIVFFAKVTDMLVNHIASEAIKFSFQSKKKIPNEPGLIFYNS